MGNKVLFGIMNILFNAYGVPDFMQGKTKSGVLKIVLSCVTCGIMAIVYEIMGIIAGIKVLTMSEETYQNTYINKVEVTEPAADAE